MCFKGRASQFLLFFRYQIFFESELFFWYRDILILNLLGLKRTFIWKFGPFLGHYDPFCLYSLPTIFYVQWGNIAIPSFKKLVFNKVYYCILLSGKYRHTCDTVREVLVSMYIFNVYFCHTFDCKSYIAVESTDTCVTRWRWGARGLGGSFVETCFPPRADLRCHLFLCPPPVRLPSSWWLGTNVEEK